MKAKAIAASTSASDTTSPPARRGWLRAKVISPGIGDSSASHKAEPPGALPCRVPDCRERRVSSDPSGSTAQMRVAGEAPSIARAQPATMPPPPVQTSRASSGAGASSASSSARVPWPAMTCGCSKGGITVAPVRAAWARARASRSSVRRLKRMISAPQRRVLATFTSGASSGMNTVAAMPREAAAQARAWPWLPLL